MTGTAPHDVLSIRRHLATRVPSYMFPRDYLFLDALPLTASGKVDRRALASLELPDDAELLGGEPPRNDIERGVAAIFEELLKLEPIGWEADFFRLGGDSLTLVQLQLELRETFGVSLANPSDDLTVGGIAEAIQREQAAAQDGPQAIPVLVPLRQRGSAPPLYLVHGRLAQALVSPHFLDLLGDDQPVWAFQARGLDGIAEPHTTIDAMAPTTSTIRKRQPWSVFPRLAVHRCLRRHPDGASPARLRRGRPSAAAARSAGATVCDARIAGHRRCDARAAQTAAGNGADRCADRRSALRAGVGAHSDRFRKRDPAPPAGSLRGPVCILASGDRLGGVPSSELAALFTGTLDRFDVATAHSEILDARNVAFGAALRRCIDIIHESAKVC